MTVSVSARTASGSANFEAAKVPAPSSKACRRDTDCGSALLACALTVCLDGLIVLKHVCSKYLSQQSWHVLQTELYITLIEAATVYDSDRDGECSWTNAYASYRKVTHARQAQTVHHPASDRRPEQCRRLRVCVVLSKTLIDGRASCARHVLHNLSPIAVGARLLCGLTESLS